MELLLIISCSLVGLFLLVMTVIGITIHDVRAIKIEKDFRRHPYAKQFRQRPLVSIIVNGAPTDGCLASIRRSNYRKIEIVSGTQPINGTLVISMPADTLLERTAISRAVRRLNNDPTIASLEFIPKIQPAQTLRQFFRMYQQLATTPFVFARVGLSIASPQTHWPTVIRTGHAAHSRRSQAYAILRWLGTVANLFALLYLTYIAIILMQPEFLLGYLLGFSLWLLWAIAGSQQLSLGQKIMYILLAPASFGYFAVRCLLAPFWPKQYSFVLSAFLHTVQPSH